MSNSPGTPGTPDATDAAVVASTPADPPTTLNFSKHPNLSHGHGHGHTRSLGLAGRIHDHAHTTPNAIAVLDSQGILTYAELSQQITATANGLRAAGLAPGDTVLFAVRPGRDAVVLGLAVTVVGAVVVVADPGAGPELDAARGQLIAERLAAPAWLAAESWLCALSANRFGNRLLRRAGLNLPALSDPSLRLIFTGRRLPGLRPNSIAHKALLLPAPYATTDLVAHSHTPTPSPAHAPAPISAPGPAPASASISASASAPVSAPASDENRPALIVFTSGTTARPRAVVHSQATLLAGADLLGESLGLQAAAIQSEPVIVHSEQLMIAFAFLAAGATWSAAPLPVRPKKFVRDLRRREATHTFGTPATIARLLDSAELPGTLKTVLLGAAPVPPPILHRLRAALPLAQLKIIYGTTEMLPIAVVDACDKINYAQVSTHIDNGGGDLAGHPLPGVSTRLTPQGELLVQGTHLAISYLGDGPIGELNTGDVARIDPDGQIVLLGRTKDMLIRGSFNLYPGLYEPAIAALAGVSEAAFVGVPDPQTADEVVVLAVVPDGSTADPGLVRLLRRELPVMIDHAALPDRIVCIPAIPRRGRSDKPDRDKLRDLIASQDGPAR
jgi:acyl-CoA synthetase (AMP-forming)/AMP-acid ligase II